ncbi:hypothetical protein HU200_011546 [Digitaria exilis]|uniref:Uncharacterized protein n=1 Tax=Digitaria exilis TaxID=1010633 RepID=A0A835KMK8_9POAL|nr:hypothetical protein HU200_011546 [Digitaria exilis]
MEAVAGMASSVVDGALSAAKFRGGEGGGAAAWLGRATWRGAATTRVRDVAYDVEDYIEDFAIHLGGSSILNRRRIAVEMKKLRARVGYAWERRPLIMEQAAPPLPARAEVNPGGPGGLAAPPSADLGNTYSALCKVSRDRQALNVDTDGRAYDELTMTGQFPFIRSLLRQFHANSVQVEEEFVLATVDVQESIETMGAPQLVRSLAENLHDKTYLLVIRRHITREEWDSIRLYFRPDVNKGSRIIVTSGIADVAKYCAGGHTSHPYFPLH